jgi:DNA-binding NarL/FixJ family response regulator
LVSTICVTREGVRALLERDASVIVTYRGDTTPASISSLCDAAPDVILVDGSCREGLDALARIRERLTSVSLLVYGVRPVSDVLLSCARDGATLVATQETEVGALVELVKTAAVGRLGAEAGLNATLLGELALLVRGVSDVGATPLTRREREIALALADGLSNKEIAQRFCISLPTVKSHVHCILRKLGVGGRDEVLPRLRQNVI